MGHTSSALALEVYAKKMARSRDTCERMDALLKTADWDDEKARRPFQGCRATRLTLS